MAIETLAYKLVMDHRQFVEGSVATRKELNLSKRLMLETEDPAKKLQKAIDSLGALHRKGAIDATTHSRAVKQLTDAFNKQHAPVAELVKKQRIWENQTVNQIPIVNRLTGAFKGLSPAAIATGAALAGFGVASAAATKAAAALLKEMEALDAISKGARKLSIDPASLVGLDLAAGRAGVGTDQLTTSLTFMVRQIGDAKRLGGETEKVFTDLGLNVNELSKHTADIQFLAIADSISKLDTQADKVSATLKIFGRSAGDMVHVLDLGAPGLAAARVEAERFGLTLDQKVLDQIEETNDNLADLGNVKKGFLRGAVKETTEEFNLFSKATKGLGLKIGPQQIGGSAASLGKSLLLGPGGKAGFDVGKELAKQAVSGVDTGLKAESDALAADLQKILDDVKTKSTEPVKNVFEGFGSGIVDAIRGGASKAGDTFSLLGKTGIGGFEANAKKAKEAIERNLNPLEKFRMELQELNSIRHLIPPEFYDRDLKRLSEGLEKTVEDQKKLKKEAAEPIRFAGATASGSQRDIELRAIAARTASTPARAENKDSKESVKLLAAINSTLKKIESRSPGDKLEVVDTLL